jgi:hypothetical protein
MTNRLKEHYRPDELARALDVNLRCVYRWIRIGWVCCIHAGKYIRIPQREYFRVLSEGLPERKPATERKSTER